jgi:hypothetical protein
MSRRGKVNRKLREFADELVAHLATSREVESSQAGYLIQWIEDKLKEYEEPKGDCCG